jgi:type I restriction enzyme, S subunit
MKSNWEVKKLGEIGNIFSGNSINEQVKKEKYANVEEGLPYIATKDISYDYKINYNNGIKIPKKDISNFKVSHKNSIFICAEGGSAGRKMAFNNQDVCFVNKLFTLEPLNSIEPKFIYCFYQTEHFQKQFKSLISGLIGGVSMNKFREIEIPIPPLSEQKYIVSILDKSFESITKAKENAEQNLKNAKEIFESYLQNVFENKGEGWEEKKLSEVCEKITDGSHNPPKEIDYSEYIMLSSKNVFNDHISNDSPRYLKRVGFEMENKRTEVKTGDVLLTIVGTIGRVAVVSNDLNKFTLQRSVAVLKNKKDILNSRFLMFLLQSIFDEILEKSRGVAQKGLYLNQIRDLIISIPPLKQQQFIVKKLDALSAETKKLEKIYQQKLNNLEELKKSILQKAFNGELTK